MLQTDLDTQPIDPLRLDLGPRAPWSDILRACDRAIPALEVLPSQGGEASAEMDRLLQAGEIAGARILAEQWRALQSILPTEAPYVPAEFPYKKSTITPARFKQLTHRIAALRTYGESGERGLAFVVPTHLYANGEALEVVPVDAALGPDITNGIPLWSEEFLERYAGNIGPDFDVYNASTDWTKYGDAMDAFEETFMSQRLRDRTLIHEDAKISDIGLT